MFKIKQFIWFTSHSYRYMQGQRIQMITGFWAAWRRFYKLAKEDYESNPTGEK